MLSVKFQLILFVKYFWYQACYAGIIFVKLKLNQMALRNSFTFWLIVLLCLPIITSGQSVGLVLSGGGPRGVTHVGVLKALEENNIPIDYIVGTSMGAIIGGLYASGYSPDEILEMISSDDLRSWISATQQNDVQFLFKEEYPNASWQLFGISYDSTLKVKLPTNFVSPAEMDFGFLTVYSGASAASNYQFDQLFRPFRCVASDIVESKEVVLRDGPVEDAIRASTTFPFYFKPIKINNRLMFDGGMYNNFPVDVLIKEFNPDIIIGCKAASNYDQPSEDDLVSQIQSMLMANTRYNVDTTNGVLITPKLWSVNVTDFSNTPQFIDSGYVATLRQLNKIESFVKRKIRKEDLEKQRNEFRNKIPSLKINEVLITGVSESKQWYLKRLINDVKLVKKINSDSLSIQEQFDLLKQSYYQILSEKQVNFVYPSLRYNPGKQAYDIVFKIDRSNKVEMELGGLVSSKAVNEIFFQLNYNQWGKTAFNLTGNAYLGRFHSSAHVAARLDIPGSLPLAMEMAYNLNGWNYFRTTTYFFEDPNPSFLIQQDSYWSMGFSTPLLPNARITTNIEAGRKRDEYYQTNQFSRLDTADLTFFNFYSPALVFESSTLNRKQFASKGTAIRFCGRLVSGLERNLPGSTSIDQEEYTDYHEWLQLRVKLLKYFKTTDFLTVGLLAEAAISNRDLFNNYTATILGAPAFEPIPENQTIFLPQFRAHNFAGGGLQFIIPIIKNMDFRMEGYIFQPYREILKTADNKATYSDIFANQYYNFSSRLTYHAPFGPISTSVNYYDQAEEPYVFNINIGYYLFNKRPFN